MTIEISKEMLLQEEQSARDEIVRIGKSFFDRGYATGSAGNLSILLSDNKTVIATPTGSCLGTLKSETLSKVMLDGEWVSGDKPSKEVIFHRAIYQKNFSHRAIVHLHCTYLTALSCLENLDIENAIKPFTPYVVMRVGEIPVVQYYRPGDQMLAHDLGELSPNYKAFLLANHGPVVTGETLQIAADNLEEMEDAAKLSFILKGSEIRYLTTNEINELKG